MFRLYPVPFNPVDNGSKDDRGPVVGWEWPDGMVDVTERTAAPCRILRLTRP